MQSARVSVSMSLCAPALIKSAPPALVQADARAARS
jgi:hypothetical protein